MRTSDRDEEVEADRIPWSDDGENNFKGCREKVGVVIKSLRNRRIGETVRGLSKTWTLDSRNSCRLEVSARTP